MTPKMYLDRYTYLSIPSPFDGMLLNCGLTGYGSGWNFRNGKAGAGIAIQHEYAVFRDALRKAHHGNALTPCGPQFYFSEKPLARISRLEEFYSDSLVRAYVGKGSPDEITDALRLALAVGRIGTERDLNGMLPARMTVQQYARDFMTLDCNCLVGNFYGANPDAHISVYASPQRRRTTIADVRQGDAIVTHCPEAPYEHVGLIEEWIPSGSSARVKICEWGWYGGEDVHYRESTHAITRGPIGSLGIGWATPSNAKPGVTSFRYIFAPQTENQPWGWS
ncbi:MAG: hypothetical protein U1E21_18345 [Reyranellaceae bacterium]